jgi:uncharacterized repeat protein (TIGR03843 family)
LTKPLVEVLLTGVIEIVGRLVAASNATLFGYVALGNQKLSIIYKPRAGERPLWDFPTGTLAGREVSSFLVSQALGWDLVPITLLRDGPYGIGMVQQWIDIDETLDVLTLVSQPHPDLRRMVLFDAIINNTDRKFGHLLPTIDGRIRGCDHGVTFHPNDKLRTVLWDWAGEPILPSELEELSGLAQSLLTGDLRESLSQHLTNEEIEMTSQRVARLLDARRFPSPGTEWPAVPWPPC